MFDFTQLFAYLTADFENWQKQGKAILSDWQKEQLKKYVDELQAPNQDTKYIRIVKEGGSVWGFVVNTHDDPKFKYGDILAPAGWKSPAKNFARGNMFEPENFHKLKWTSAR